MGRGFSILLFIPALLCVLLLFAGHAIAEADYNEFEEYRLEKVNNYATDAALQEILRGDDLEQDYIATDRVTINPDTGRDTYLTVLSLSYDIPVTTQSLRSLSAEYLDVFIVAAYDGYYSYIKEGVTTLNVTTPTDYSSYTFFKVPYVYINGGTPYYFDMKYEDVYSLGTDQVHLAKASDVGLTSDIGYSLINQQINKEINAQLELNLANGSLGNVVIPTAATTVGTVNNRVEGVSVLALINNVDFTTSKRLNAFSIGGARIKPTRMIACYTRDGKKYYAYVDKIASSTTKPYNFDVNNVNKWAEYAVNTMEEAASLGYSYDMVVMEGT